MANDFYNPFMKGPDFAGGLSGVMSNPMIMMMLLKKMRGQPGQMGDTPLGVQGMGGFQGTGARPGNELMSQATLPGMMQDQEMTQGQGIDPQMLQMIMQLLPLLGL